MKLGAIGRLSLTFLAAAILVGCQGEIYEKANNDGQENNERTVEKPDPVFQVTCYSGGQKIYEGKSADSSTIFRGGLDMTDLEGNRVESNADCVAIKLKNPAP